MKRNGFLFGAVAIAFSGFGIFFAERHTRLEAADPSVVQYFLSQSLIDQSGKSQQMTQWKDKVLVINFWATWCAPCVDEMPELVELQDEIGAAGNQIIGIGIDSAPNIAAFASKHKITYPLYVAGVEGTSLARRFGNESGGLPFTVVVDRTGRVHKAYLGRLKMDELRKDLQAL
jgi:thiol-disulfide isomerase/thioredoxin